MNLAQFTEAKLLVPQLVSEWREDVISELSQRLKNVQRIENASAFTHAVLAHEALGSAVFDEVALPLARANVVKELSFAVGLSARGVRWGIGKTLIVHTIILFAVPSTKEQAYLLVLSMVSAFLKNEVRFSALRRCLQPEEMLSVLNHIHYVHSSSAE
jgi:mannitol/fructose-specific phosphotransferase system IIA component (Ntr-type)